MRYVDRNSVLPPPALTGPDSTGALELAKAIKHYGDPATSSRSFEFEAYKDQDVLDALQKLFHGKCAYCESVIKAISPIDIEHYRPKGGVKEDKAHGGYWWLAAEWTNLLAACPDCNRERYQQHGDESMTGADLAGVKKRLSGKKNAFPIAGAKRACCATDNHDDEDPLLIDPTRRNPVNHLHWMEVDHEGKKLSLVTPKDVGGKPDPYADHSIGIYGLNRRGVVESRTELMQRLAVRLESIRDYIDMAAGFESAKLERYLLRITKDFDELRAHAKPEMPYSECVKAFIDLHSAEIITELDALKQSLKPQAA